MAKWISGLNLRTPGFRYHRSMSCLTEQEQHMELENVVDGNLMDVEVLPVKAHSEECANQAYCLNGGTCYRIPSLGRHFCECMEQYEGERCHMKKVIIPGINPVIHDGPFNFDWKNMQVIVVVVGCTLLVMILLCFIYFVARIWCKRCYRRKTLYLNVSPRKPLIPVYENASVQTSNSLRCLLSDTECNGHLTSDAENMSRTRLVACSVTPDNDAFLQVNKMRRNSDLESGHGRANDFVDSSHTSVNRTAVLTTECNTTEGSLGGQIKAENKNNAKESTAKEMLKTNQPNARANCVSPNDSNNNKDAFLFSSQNSREHSDNTRQAAAAEVIVCAVGNCELSKKMTNSPAVMNTCRSDPYDSDPEATVL